MASKKEKQQRKDGHSEDKAASEVVSAVEPAKAVVAVVAEPVSTAAQPVKRDIFGKPVTETKGIGFGNAR